jgi:hypothetical protein
VPSARLSRAVAVGGDLTLANTAGVFAELAAVPGGPGAGGFDLTIPAAAGDVLTVSGAFQGNNATAVAVLFDLPTWVTGAAVNWLGQSAGGTNIGLTILVTTVANTAAFSVQYVVQAGDLTGGTVVLRPHYRAGGGRTLSRSVANGPLMLSVANLLH